MPERRQRGGTDAALGHQLFEGREVAAFLLGHASHRLAAAAAPKHRELSRIDAHGAVLARVIDTDEALDRVADARIAGEEGWAPVAHRREVRASWRPAAAKLRPANTAEATRL